MTNELQERKTLFCIPLSWNSVPEFAYNHLKNHQNVSFWLNWPTYKLFYGSVSIAFIEILKVVNTLK